MTRSAAVNDLAVSSFSLRQTLGNVVFEALDPAGFRREVRLEGNHTETLQGFVRHIKQQCDVTLIELCQVQLSDASPADIDEIRDALAETGVRLLSMPIDVGDLSHPLAEVRERSLRANIDWFDVAQGLGASYVRVNALSSLAATDQAAPFDCTVESTRRLAREASKRGLGLLLENKGGMVDYPHRMIEVIKHIGSSHVGVVLDTGNIEPLASAMIGRLQGKQLPSDLGLDYAYEMVALMAPHATVVHAKSHGFDADGRQGPMDLGYALGIIKDAGFTGPVTVEYEGIEGDPWVNTRRTVDIVRSVFA